MGYSYLVAVIIAMFTHGRIDADLAIYEISCKDTNYF